MTHHIEQAETILNNSGLFSAVNRRTLPTKYAETLGEYCLDVYFKARRVDTVYDLSGAEKVLSEIQKKVAPYTVGEGVAVKYYTDCHAARVIWVSEDGKRIRVQEDTATLLNGFDSGEKDALKFHPGGFFGHTEGAQRYKLEANPDGAVHEFTLRVNGEWVAKGDDMKSPGKYLVRRHFHFHDYNF